MDAVVANNLRKVYGKDKQVAVDNVSFKVKKGELFGLIGPDGAGKTSLFRMLTTLLLPDDGTASINGLDIVRDYQSIRNTVGYMPGKFSLYQDLTIEENLSFFATVFGTSIEENYDLIRDIYVQIEKFKNRRAGKLSGGMKQKLALCCALIHKPSILFLDEPTTGVDPVSRKEFWDMLQRLKEQQITILVSTPYMDEATRCDRIALLQTGRIMSINTPAEIIAQYPDPLFAAKAGNMFGLLKTLKTFEHSIDSYAFGEFAHVSLRNADEHKLSEFLMQNGLTEVQVLKTTPTIEDCFIHLLRN